MRSVLGIVIIVGSVVIAMIPALMSMRAAFMFKRFDHKRITYWWDRLYPVGMVGLILGFAVLEGVHPDTDIIDLLIASGGLIALIGFPLLLVRRSLRQLSGIYAFRERKLAQQRRRREKARESQFPS